MSLAVEEHTERVFKSLLAIAMGSYNGEVFSVLGSKWEKRPNVWSQNCTVIYKDRFLPLVGFEIYWPSSPSTRTTSRRMDMEILTNE